MPANTFPRLACLLLCSLALTACSSDSDDNTPTNSSPNEPVAASFSASQTWEATLPAPGSSICYDFDAGQEVTCDTGNVWDLKLEYPSGSRTSPKLWTNSGVTNANGQGGAFGLFTWSDLQQWDNATTEPDSGADVSQLYAEDSASSVFSQNLWYAYNLNGHHQLYPNYKVYLITSDSSKAYDPAVTTTYALQVTGYYGGTSGTESGHVSLRWIDVNNPSTVHSVEVDASSHSAWAYVDLASESVYSSLPTADWQIAIRRSEIKLNGGISAEGGGNGKVAGFVAIQPAGFYDSNGEPVKAKFTSTTPADTESALTTTASYTTPANASEWIKDEKGSVLMPEAVTQGHYPNMTVSYGVYSYQMQSDSDTPAHGFSANADQGALLRSGSGDSYARFHLTSIVYADPADGSSTQTWTFEFDVQPAL